MLELSLLKGVLLRDAIFPVGLVIDESYLSFEEMKQHEEGWDVSSTQMEEGSFYSEIRGFHTPRMQLAYQTYSKAMLLSGRYPKQCIVLYIAATNTPPIVHNVPTIANELSVGFPEEDLDVLINGSSKYYTIAVEKELFLRLYYNYFGTTLEETIVVEKLLIKEERLQPFFEGLDAWINYLSNTELKATFEYRYDVIETDILDFIFGHITVEEKLKKRSKFDVTIIREYLEQNLKDDIDIAGLATSLKISERQIYNVFKENYGVTPMKYLQQLRLNAIKKELISATSKTVKISDIAYKYKFEHMSHFSNEYRKLFGKAPSSTLQ